MHTIWSRSYEIDIGPHVFPTRKYRLVKERVVADGTVAEDDVIAPSPATDEDLARVHTMEYLRKIRENDFTPADRLQLEVPFSPELREAMVLCCGGTLECGRRSLAEHVCVHLGGGFHHAFAGHGEGFCLLNDVAVAARTLLDEGAVERVGVIDLDVHHGNGTAAIFADDPAVFTFSMHQENNYPALKPDGDLDVGLRDRIGDDDYLAILDRHLTRMLDGRAFDLVFFLAGADPYREDQLGGLGLTVDGLRARDRLVLGACRRRGVPVAVTLAGGYAFDTDDTIEIHCNTVREAAACE
ncbi:MAG: histone deacetylase [Gemmatimonadota bacterium]